MTNSVIGALRVTLGLDSAAFDKGAEKTSRNFGRLKKDADGLSSGFGEVGVSLGKLSGVLAGLIGGLSLGALAAAGKQALDFADDLATAADQTGIGVERFQTLKQTFRALEISGETFDKSMRSLLATLGDVQNGVDSGATKALDRMGITSRILNGEIDTTDKLLDAIADSAKGFGTQAEFASAVTDIFGKKAGPQLAAALRNGSEALKNMEADLRSAGTVLTEEQINKLADANEVIDRWQENASYRMAIFAADAITAFEKAGAAFDEWRRKQMDAETRAAKEDNWLTSGLRAYGRSRRGATTRMAPVVRTNPASGSDVNRRLGFDITSPVVPKPTFTRPTGGGGGGGGRRRGGGSGGSGANAKKDADQFGQAMEALKRRVADARSELDLLGMSLNEIDAVDARLRMEALRFEQERGAKWTKEQKDQYRAAAEELRVLNVATERLTQLQAEIVDYKWPDFIDDSKMESLLAKLAETPDLASKEFGLPMVEVFGQVADGVADAMARTESAILGFVQSIKKGDIIGIIGGIADIIGSVVGTIRGFRTGFGTQPTPGKASGGPITAGRPYLVGERGPELIVPNTSGSVIPNGRLRGPDRVSVEVIKGEMFDVVVRRMSTQVANEQIGRAAPGIAAQGAAGAVKRLARMRDRSLVY